MIRLCAFADEYSKNFDEQTEGLRKNGISLTELRSADGKNVADFTDDDAKRYFEKLSDNGIAVWSVGSPLGKTDVHCDFTAYEQKIRRVCRTANILHCDKIRMFSFYNAYGEPDKVTELLGKMVRIADEYGVKMYHENEKEVFGDVTERVEYLIQNVQGLKFVYDPANFVQCGVDCGDALARLFDKIDYFHIKDVTAQGEVVPAGCGIGHVDELIEYLARENRDVVLTVEPHLKVFDGYGQIDGTALKNKFVFTDNQSAFDCAVLALKALLIRHGYREEKGAFVK